MDSNAEIQCVVFEIDNCWIRKPLNFEISLFEKGRHSPFLTPAPSKDYTNHNQMVGIVIYFDRFFHDAF